MNKLALIVKDKTVFCRCYRNLYILSKNTAFDQHDKKALPVLLAQRESLISLSHERHASVFAKLKSRLKNALGDSVKVRVAAALVYEKMADDLDYNSFIKCFQLPDTFLSWFIFVEVHTWMVLVTTISERHGREFRNTLIDAMWHDVETRMGHLTYLKSSSKKKYLRELVGQFQAALVSFDEGILSEDSVLAAAAWRTMYACKMVDPELLEKIVIYIRRQLAHLDAEPTENIIINGCISFLPLQTIFAESKE